MCSTSSLEAPEPITKPDRGEEPQKHVRQQNPHCVLHACDARVSLCVFGDVHLAEDAKCNEVADEDEHIDEEVEVVRYLRDHADKCHDGAQSAANNGPDPF